VAAKKRSTTERELKREVKTLRSKLERADARANRWKAKARRADEGQAQAQAQVKKLNKRLDKATRPGQIRVSTPPRATSTPTTDPVPSSDAAALETQSTARTQARSAPDATWTVVRLREEARARGLTGVSGKTKAQLLTLLT
jgi:hypothetical protein